MLKKNSKPANQIQIDQVVKKLYGSFINRLKDIPHFAPEDYTQEINLVVLKCLRLYKEDNLSSSSFYTYAYRAFNNHLCNLKKKHLYKPISPCNASCPKYVIPAKSCTSEQWQKECPKFLSYEQMQKDSVHIGRATDTYMEEASYEMTDFADHKTLDDIIAYAVRLGQNEEKFRQTLLNLINSKRIDEEYRKVVKLIVAQYKKEFGI